MFPAEPELRAIATDPYQSMRDEPIVGPHGRAEQSGMRPMSPDRVVRNVLIENPAVDNAKHD